MSVKRTRKIEYKLFLNIALAIIVMFVMVYKGFISNTFSAVLWYFLKWI
jgi:hypothetical protein